MPHFRAAALPTPVCAASRRISRIKQSRKDHWSSFDAPKDTDDEKLVYDTIGGKVRPLHRKDLVIKTSPETPCYVMQTLNISGIDVLTFYDSGANNNLTSSTTEWRSKRDSGC